MYSWLPLTTVATVAATYSAGTSQIMAATCSDNAMARAGRTDAEMPS